MSPSALSRLHVPLLDRPGRLSGRANPPQASQAAVAVNEEVLTREAQRQASFLVVTNLRNPEHLPGQELIQTYKEQGNLERGCAFLKDPLFLALAVRARGRDALR
jgi:hypothetical protein